MRDHDFSSVLYYNSWTLLVETYNFNGQLTTGLDEGQRMFDDAVARKDDYGKAMAYYAMGGVYANMNNYEEGAEAYRQSIDLLLNDVSADKPDSLSLKLSDIFSNYGDVLETLGRYKDLDQLTVRWEKFLTAYYSKPSRRDNAYMYASRWGYYYLACAQAALGLDSLERASSMLDEVKKRVFDDGEFLNLSWLYYRAQLCLKQGFYDEALALNTLRMRYLSDAEDSAEQIRMRQQRAEILKGMGRFREAAELYREMYVINDSTNTHDMRRQLTEMNTKYQVGELRAQQAEQEKRNIIIISTIIVLALAIFMFFRIRAQRRLKQAHIHLEEAHEKLEDAHGKLQTAYDQLEETTIAKERIESDLRIARDIQMGMVPHTFPDRPDLDLYASMTPAKEVGGDLYDYLIIGDTLYFCLGDVSGKGVPASLFMAMARNLFHVLAQQQLSPAEIATRLNNTLAEDNDAGMFVTMFIGEANLKNGHLDFCNAGHNPPVLIHDIHAAGGEDTEATCEFVEMIPNAPIGLWPELDYEGEEIGCISDKPLFVYTDGLNEAENRQQDQFTDERLLDILGHTTFEGCQQTVELLRDEVEKHRDGADPNDDLTMLCVMVKTTAETSTSETENQK
ncbi:MAG: serine/threonine-protein phosphatase [Prevotella sp.]|nr:serine/threonine-protein phosphatase [Prevotella sp.]